ncbi:hypothetical protein T12_15574 [Trichinella patagoniensis]|uniref:Uncharacterized protein n=1 Tax=Trichinella patagoniensis TaxID=990121 RepID=A0A0V0YPT1_9BILA|nr:hypothetical protein T12_15574 [Trichinella patagoniensis]
MPYKLCSSYARNEMQESDSVFAELLFCEPNIRLTVSA